MAWSSWLENSIVGWVVRESEWGYAIVLSSHALGMAVVVGTAVMFDFRILGFGRELVPRDWFRRLFPLTWIAIGANVLSGAALFCGDPAKFVGSTAFQIKLLLIVIGTGCFWYLGKRQVDDTTVTARPIAALSLLCWFGAIVVGRLIAYTTGP